MKTSFLNEICVLLKVPYHYFHTLNLSQVGEFTWVKFRTMISVPKETQDFRVFSSFRNFGIRKFHILVQSSEGREMFQKMWRKSKTRFSYQTYSAIE